jgi:hypothetical protein
MDDDGGGGGDDSGYTHHLLISLMFSMCMQTKNHEYLKPNTAVAKLDTDGRLHASSMVGSGN